MSAPTSTRCCVAPKGATRCCVAPKDDTRCCVACLSPKDATRRCVAPNCQETCYGESLHCRACSRVFSKQYLAYKQLQSKIDAYLLTRENDASKVQALSSLGNTELLKVISISNRVVELRLRYRHAAFRPEYHDVGHGQFLESIKDFHRKAVAVMQERFYQPKEGEGTEGEVGVVEEKEEVDEVGEEAVKVLTAIVANQKSINEELKVYLQEKRQHISSIEQVLKAFIAMLNEEFVEEDEAPLSVEEPNIGLISGFVNICCLVEDYLFKGKKPDVPRGVLDTTIPGQYKLQTKTSVINRQHIASNFQEAVEFIYQGRQLFSLPPDDGYRSIRYEAMAALIVAARRQPGNFTYYFKVDWMRGEKVTAVLEEHKNTYYPKEYKKNYAKTRR